MKKTRLLQFAALLVSATLFGLSLFQPVWKCANGGTPFDGLSVLAIGFMGLLALTPAWFCNGLLLLAVASLIQNRHVGPNWIPYAFAGVALTALFGPHLCGVNGGPLGPGSGLDKGAMLWVTSICFAALSMHFAPNTAEKDAVEFQPTQPTRPRNDPH